MKWLMRLLGLIPVDRPADLTVEKQRSDAVLRKASRVLVEEKRIDTMRASFKRAGGRLG